MAVHNGEAFLCQKLLSLLALNYPAELIEIVVVSDGSTDRTDAMAESFARRGVRFLRVPRAGKAEALNAGLRLASREIVLFTDVRQALDPDALAHLVSNFADPSVGAVTGELRYLPGVQPGKQAGLDLYWRYELWARGRHSEMDSLFGATGCIYAVRRALVEPIEPDTLSDDVLIPVRVFLGGRRVIFERSAIAYDYHPAAGEFWRKLRTLAGLWQAFARVPALFTGANRMRFHFLSHKFGRLILPWALLLGAGSLLAMPHSPAKLILLAGAGAFLVLGALDYALPRRLVLRRLTSPLRTFLEMNAAALLSVIVFFVPPRALWRSASVKPSGLTAERPTRA
jgi:cellulose synthase/poly-beta-1,6-N-acetylglucosamine synthase-like glycosyltransferase